MFLFRLWIHVTTCTACTFVNFVYGVVCAKGVGTISSEDFSSAICALVILYL